MIENEVSSLRGLASGFGRDNPSEDDAVYGCYAFPSWNAEPLRFSNVTLVFKFWVRRRETSLFDGFQVICRLIDSDRERLLCPSVRAPIGHQLFSSKPQRS